MGDDYTEEVSPERRGLQWRRELDAAESENEEWIKRGERVVARYRDERDSISRARSRFNILWSNVEILKPALYGRDAKPQVTRRHLNPDPVARVASTILENILDYEARQYPDFHAGMMNAVEDRSLPGRGTVWMVRTDGEGEPISAIDYVYWKDFLHSGSRTWSEVWWVARYVYMTREEGIDRFGDVFKNVPLQKVPRENGGKKTNANDVETQKAKVAEIWNKRDKTVCWLATGYNQLLDEQEDPLGLEEFFPCPKPLLATTTTGTMIPVPDYAEYQDQAQEMDDLTNRIRNLVKAIKVSGVFNAEYKELGRVLDDSADNRLVPVTNWAGFAEKGGLKGAIDLINLDTQIKALSVLYNARESAKQVIYEITGISDIMRGSTNAEETLGAQQLKSNFGSMRLRNNQEEVARFASDIFRIKAEVVCRFYPPELMVAESGIMDTDEAKQNPGVIPAAIELLQNSQIRDFRIEVDSDTLAQIDEQQQKAEATEAVTAIGGFIKEALPMVEQAPESLPIVRTMLLALTRRYKFGRQLEAAIEQSFTAIEKKLATPQPSPEQIEAQQQAQADQMRVQADLQLAQAKAGFDAQVQQNKLQTEAQLAAMKSAQEKTMRQMELQVEMYKAATEDTTKRWIQEMVSATQLQVAEIGAKSRADASQKQLDGTRAKKNIAPPPEPDSRIDDLSAKVIEIDDLSMKVAEMGEMFQKMLVASKAPKDIKRDAQGRISAVIPRLVH